MERSRLSLPTILSILAVLLSASFAAAGTDECTPLVEEVACIPWAVDQAHYSATVTEEIGGDVPVRRVVFRRRGEPTTLPGVTYETMDAFLAAMPLAPPSRGHLLTVWATGTALRVVIFAARAEGVAVVMDAATSGLPELADLDDDGSPEILTTEGKPPAEEGGGVEAPAGAVQVSVYGWSGNRYRVFRTVPWEERLGKGR